MVIELTNGKVAHVSNIDFVRLSKFKWCALKIGNNWYAVRNTKGARRSIVYMHREIKRVRARWSLIDHRDGDGLNNRRRNLRVCKQHQNMSSRQAPANTSSGYKGVTKHTQNGNWCAQITHKYKRIYLGVFDDIVDAALAYNRAAKKYHGRFAVLNIIPAKD